MRICLNLLAALAGGQITRADAFLRRFAHQSAGDELIVLKEFSVLQQWQHAPDFEVATLRLGGLGPTRALRRLAWEHLRLRQFMRRKRADVFLTFSHYLPRNFPASLPSVVGVANLAPFSPLARQVENPLMRMKLAALERSIISAANRATRVIALSQTCRSILVDRGIAAEKIRVVPNGIADDYSRPAGGGGSFGEHGITRPYVLYVGHFFRYKNQVTLLKAYARLPRPLRDAHQLVLVGEPFDRGYFDELHRLRDDLGVTDGVVIVPGERGERLRRLYQGAALFAFPSLIENCPNSLLEAMASGAPVVASDVAPMPEFAGAAGNFFDALDPDACAAAIARVLSDPAESARMRARSREVASSFSWELFVRDTLATCRDAAANGRAVGDRSGRGDRSSVPPPAPGDRRA